VLPKMKIVPDIVTAGLDTVALRMPDNAVALALIKAAGTPIAAPSANRFGSLSPTTAAHARDQLQGKSQGTGHKAQGPATAAYARTQLQSGPDMILDGGCASIGVESTVLAFNGGGIFILRHGGLPQEVIERVTGRLNAALKGGKRPASPGQLIKHYSPRAVLRITGRTPVKQEKGLSYGYLAFTTRPEAAVKIFRILSRSGNLEEAAANLFSHLHALDRAGVDVILAEPVPARGLGRAIMDRLKRAAASKASGFELVLSPGFATHDGRHANNSWLQETPDPITKMTWDNPVSVSVQDAMTQAGLA